MHRFFLPPESISAHNVSFPGEVARQICQVLRLHAGQQVIALDNQGNEYAVSLTQVTPKAALGDVLSVRRAEGEPARNVALYLCLSQREKFEWMLQKCTEVGAACFTPVISSRSLVRDGDSVAKKLERWRQIIREAAEQCGRGRLPELLPVCSLDQAVKESAKYPLALIAWERETVRTFKQALAASEKHSAIAVLIGPEGGFSEEEAALAQAAGWTAVTLGRRILRMETAAIVATALAVED